MHHLGQFLAGKRSDGPKEALQILDIVLRELSMKRYGKLRVKYSTILFDKHAYEGSKTTLMNGLMHDHLNSLFIWNAEVCLSCFICTYKVLPCWEIILFA